MIENVSTQLTVFHCLCPLPASRKGLRLHLRSALLEKEAEIGGRVSTVDRDLNQYKIVVPLFGAA